MGRLGMIVVGEAAEESQAAIDVHVAGKERLEHEELALVGLLLDDLPRFAVQWCEGLGASQSSGGMTGRAVLVQRAASTAKRMPQKSQSMDATVTTIQPRSQSQRMPRQA